ncbi:hypothetical protein H6F77_01860 [Microcoleus sp. FACHB-831]|uniref:hypothetical protein n=1 Tax=Microcoleus sp. FACHB-831 TaxID=2692827 RepID=UPI0016885B92|nr:hypothetical protein [Microcoleus sp. FACHB-831]MBD1919864.1 hypothetical protein [Microcoleus sp. FACHB-831]
MNNLTNMRSRDDDNTQIKLEKLWGNGWNKLTPEQRQMVAEILTNLKPRGLEAW